MIQFENVSKSYPGSKTEVVKDISFTIPEGKLVVIIGPSGCGKTTCLKMINRLIKLTSGVIRINGRDIMEYDPIRLRRSMGYVIQQTGLFPHMTVRENIEIIPHLEGTDKERVAKRTLELMKMVELNAEQYLDRYPTQLSGGQLQRVGVARAFATDPEIILMDEPFSALDPITREQLQDELLYMQTKLKKTIVFVTHDMDEAVKLADFICIIKDGEIVQYDTPEQIMKNPANAYVADFVGRNRIWANPEYIYAKDIMIPDPVCVHKELSLLHTIEIMREHRVTSVMVTDDGNRYLGIVTARDIQQAGNRELPVSTLVHDAALLASPEDSMVKLLKEFNDFHVSTVPVIGENGELLGIITSSSLVTTLSEQYVDYKEVGTK